MPITQEVKTDSRKEMSQETAPTRTRRPIPPPGRIVGFNEALAITLREDKELLRRLAQ